MNEVIYYAFSEHQYLLHSERLNKEEKTLFAYLFNKLQYGKLKEVKLQGALKKLSQLLYIHFENKQAIILIDEYDSPIGQALLTKEAPLAKIITFIGMLMSNLLKDNNFVDGGLINACVRLAVVLSGHANNIKHLQYLGNHELSAFYGFTAREVKSLLKRVGMLERFDEAKYWYNGYVSSDQNIKMYNGWSIINFMLEKVARKHWIETVDMACLENVCSLEPIRNRIFEMLQDNTVKIKKIDKIQITHILVQHLQDLINAPLASTVTTRNSTVDLFLQFMSDYGYFNMSDTNSHRLLSIPNKEIGEELAQKLYTVSFFIKNHTFNGNRISAFTQALKNLQPENKHGFRNLAKCVCKLFSEIPYPSNEEELRASLITFASDHPNFETHAELYVRKNRHLRLDILIIRSDGVAIILEVKCFRESAIKALNQILINKYYRILRKQEYKQRVKQRIYIGLHMNRNKSVSLSYLTNSKKINNRQDVFYSYSK
jgi:hypothetical protein